MATIQTVGTDSLKAGRDKWNANDNALNTDIQNIVNNNSKNVIYRGWTTADATPKIIGADGTANGLVIPEDTTWLITLKVVARKKAKTGETKAWEIKAMLQNTQDTPTDTAIATVGSITTTVLYNTANTTGWNVALTTSGNSTVLTVTGQATTNINWLAYWEIVEISGV